MKDDIAKNTERVTAELRALGREYLVIIKRFRWVTLPGMESRSPAGEPRNNGVFHLLTAFIEELYDQAPRTCAYITIAWLITQVAASFY